MSLPQPRKAPRGTSWLQVLLLPTFLWYSCQLQIGTCYLLIYLVHLYRPKWESGRWAPLQLMNTFKTPQPADTTHRKHFQEIPDQSTNATTSFMWGWDSSKTSELLSGMEVHPGEGGDGQWEHPPELLSNLGHPQSPPGKRLKSKGNDRTLRSSTDLS